LLFFLIAPERFVVANDIRIAGSISVAVIPSVGAIEYAIALAVSGAWKSRRIPRALSPTRRMRRWRRSMHVRDSAPSLSVCIPEEQTGGQQRK